MNRLKLLLFAMTGLGNNAFKALMGQPFVDLLAVFTSERQDIPFPYYQCEQLHEIAQRHKIPIHEGYSLKKNEPVELIRNVSPDLIVVGTFNKIIPQSIISIPKLGVINIHPSLLPKYKGATPTVWALINGEEETGVTIHFIDDETIDSGRIVTQARMRIEPSDTDGSLRYKLAELSEKLLIDALLLISKRDKSSFPLQNEREATRYPKRSLKDAEIDTHRPFKDIVNKIRAMSPFPGAYIKVNNKSYVIKNATIVSNERASGEASIINGKKLVLSTLEGIVEFDILKEI